MAGTQWELERPVTFLWQALSLLSCKSRYKVATALSNGSTKGHKGTGVTGGERGNFSGTKSPLA